MRTDSQIAEFKSHVSALLDVIGILAIIAAVPAYILLIGLVTSVTLPVYFLASEINRQIASDSHLVASLKAANGIR